MSGLARVRWTYCGTCRWSYGSAKHLSPRSRQFFDSFPLAIREMLQRAEDYAFERMPDYRRTSIKQQLRLFSA